MKIRVKICRYDPEKDKAPYFKTYMVDYEPGMRLLHALEHVKNEKEPSLAFRWNCGAGRCGSCAAEVNGRPVLICKYEVPHKAEEIVIEPMKVFPIVRDLVTDLAVMREAQGKIPAFKSAKKPFFKMYDYDIGMAKEMKKCIECGICQDICHVIREHKKNYIGPRFIVKLASFETHPFISVSPKSSLVFPLKFPWPSIIRTPLKG